jgi:carbamoyl-phosphate synthase large subunit
MSLSNQPTKVMIAGIGGASLGTEILKSLRLAGGYEIYGCDVSPTAYGLYQSGFAKTYRVNRESYVSEVINVCRDAGVSFLIPGGEQPMQILGAASFDLASEGIELLGNSSEVISLFSNKKETFEYLRDRGVKVPKTIELDSREALDYVGLPCIVKPSTGTGGSVSVFYAVSVEEALTYAEFIRRGNSVPIAQEYVDDSEGEFTIGVLSLPEKQVVGSIALRRVLDAKLSVSYRERGGVVSSGYSQGHIGKYLDLRLQAEKIAEVVGSCGPLNIQGRVRNGTLLPFEINPRFSASTYLRAMAGFNEIDMLIQYRISGIQPEPSKIKSGWYLRSLTEQFINEERII